MNLKFSVLIAVWIFSTACNSTSINSNKSDSSLNKTSEQAISSPDYDSTGSDDEESNEDENGSVIEDGEYLATVDYDNPNTGYSATYTLYVEVSDGQVVRIEFPNDGYLDEDNITATDLDDEGNALVEGEDGKTYNIHIDI